MLREMMVTQNTIILALTETHLRKEILEAEINIAGYGIFRADRCEDRPKGGVAIYIRDDIIAHSSVLLSGSTGTIEYLMIHIKTWNLVVINVYRSPPAVASDFLPVIADLKAQVLGMRPEPSILMVGDFNMPHTNWESGEISGGGREEREQASCMLDLASDLMLTQTVDIPTRGRNTLDLVFTNDDDLIMKIGAEDIIMSDYRIVLVECRNTPYEPKTRPRSRIQ